MKTLFKTAIAIIFVVLLMPNLTGYAQVERSDELIMACSEPIKYYTAGENHLLIFDQQVVYGTETEEITIEGKYQNHLWNSGNLYLIIEQDNVTYILRYQQLKLAKKESIDHKYQIKQLLFEQDYLYLIGGSTEFNQGVIIIMNQELKLVKSYQYGLDSHFIIHQIIKYHDEWIGIATIDAHPSDEQFANVGNYGEQKTLLFRLNNHFQLKDICYFNNQYALELPTFFQIQNDQIYIIISASEVEFDYIVDPNLTNPTLTSKKEKCDQTLLSYNGEFLKVKKDDGFKIMNQEAAIINEASLNYKAVQMSGGKLEVIYYQDGNLKKALFDEYHINYLNNLTISHEYRDYYEEQDLNHTKAIDVSSFFSSVKVYSQTHFNSYLPGLYDVNLVIERDNCPNILIGGKLEVFRYCNIKDQGIYRTGKVLEFLGNATLNNNMITSGYCINKSGTYELAIKDQKEGSVTYHFNVVDDYYLPDEQFISADYNVLPNGAVYLDFEIGDLTGLEAVYLDSGETPFIVDGNILKVYYEAQSSFSIETLELVKIVKSGVEIEVHKQFSVKTLRHTPHLAIKEQESMSPAFVIKVDDPDQSIRSIELQMGDVKLFNFLQNEAMNLGDIKNKDLPLYVYINYDLGDGIIQRKKVLYLDAKYQNGEVLSLNYQFVGSKMDTINLDVNLKSIKELRQLSVNSENLALNYQTAVNYQNVWISVMISGMVIILIIIYLVIRKRQRGRFDYLKK